MKKEKGNHRLTEFENLRLSELYHLFSQPFCCHFWRVGEEEYAERKNRVILTWKFESLVNLKFDPAFRVIGEYLSQTDLILRFNYEIDTQYRVNLTQIYSNYSESRVVCYFCQWLKFSGQNDSIFLSVIAGEGSRHHSQVNKTKVGRKSNFLISFLQSSWDSTFNGRDSLIYSAVSVALFAPTFPSDLEIYRGEEGKLSCRFERTFQCLSVKS